MLEPLVRPFSEGQWGCDTDTVSKGVDEHVLAGERRVEYCVYNRGAAAQGESAYRPLVERLADDGMASIDTGGIQVAGDYQLPDVDLRALAARREEDGFLERMDLTYRQGVDGWIDDCIAFTQPWEFELSQLTTPTSIWYGPADVLASRAHHEYLLSVVPDSTRHELSGGHVLSAVDIAAIYDWLAR